MKRLSIVWGLFFSFSTLVAAQEFPILTFKAAKQAADAGDARAQGIVSLYYRYGYQTPQSLKDAKEAISSRSAEYPLCRYDLAVLLLNEAQCSADVPESSAKAGEAKRLFHLSYAGLAALAKEGDPYAELLLGGLYETGRGDTHVELAKASSLYLSSSRKGLPPALVNLGRLVIDGKGVQQNTNTAISLFKNAIQADVGSAIYEMGNVYMDGKGVPVSKSQARDCWAEASQRYNHAASQYVLGRALIDGSLGEVDQTGGARLIYASAANGCPEATRWVAESGTPPPPPLKGSSTPAAPAPTAPHS